MACATFHASGPAIAVIRAWEEHRARHTPAVPFYIYDGLPGFNLLETISAIGQCTSKLSSEQLQHAGEYFFLRALSTHRWRVQSPRQAALFVLPFMPTFELRNTCTGYNTTALQQQIVQTRTWREHRRSHLLLSTEPSIDRWDAAHSIEPHLFTPHEPAYGKSQPAKSGAVRSAIVEQQQQQPLLASFEAIAMRSPHNTIVAPYTNRPPTDESERRVLDLRSSRPFSFFFGGQASRGRLKSGNYARWALFEAAPSALPRGALLVATPDATNATGWTGTVSAPLSNAPREGLRACDWLNGDSRSGPRVGIREMPHRCIGAFDPAELLLRTEFALAPRGDTASSRRLVEAMQYGAIPVIISDAFFQVRTAPLHCTDYLHVTI
jgi:hypothetical protein